jgi:uncharacterized protein YndB with AHSA1/START domain
MVMGILNVFYWRKHTVTDGQAFLYGLYNLVVALLISAFFMGEGIICLVIVSPVFYLFLMGGIYLGRFMFRKSKHKLNISIIAALVSIFAINVATVSPSSQIVTDKVVINASPDQVWNYVVSFPQIEDKPDYWLFKIGLPAPVQSTAEGNYLGAGRKCIFSNGAVFDEEIVEYEPSKKLTFKITQQPNDPEIMGHLNLLEGQFILEDNGDGTTTLIGNSWYDLKIKPSLYFDIWTKDIIRNVHLRVMDHIKALSEADA